MNAALHTIARDRIREHVGEAEWSARVQLAAVYRLLHRYGMTDLVYNHATLRVPGTDHFLINAYGYLYDEICASNLLKIDLDGRVVLAPEDPHEYGVNVAGYVIHSAIHRARRDVHCVIHTHTRAGMAVSAMADGLLPLTQTAMRFYGRIGYHDYESVAIDLDEQARLVADLGGHDAMILRNHGLLATGTSAAQAFNTMYWLELACRAQVDAMAGGARLHLPPEAIREKTAHLYDRRTRRPFGELEWPAMLRELDRIDPGYRN
jgi:ribulose-5-phosphate 4-epimerase/fuculose-1-phosphate aldolase